MRSYSVMVITLDSESSDPGSSPGRTFTFFAFAVRVPVARTTRRGAQHLRLYSSVGRASAL